ncbi:ShlB/FhaC/HecB family hemolysin secretion/activation protein [Pseudomonas aeruginosa]|uniref:ShlB/FhaC/HecB family hemolysin secretion/activation protein n=1 Tax=Pseudomonas aeruginosa TaxID=287 RepID=UPI0005BE1B06|nr:ShlB/FhaC/HecB family hemolysin secretion/activation protein [Pseudomonas aeruginosa]AYL28201.1 ShlB/FhaC/HecB family hemolysin secretion/activation protein [Pseudomonas aeruginosa]AZM81810.1 ShlB/FhaC/HecB family hemolysin secretion/activation protein [Pseudomonas aeruginosa]EJA2566564.1 ShlB/FhaC/HecB family hemolysin secretion/activation protein [Pseudomonas aeruginosa]EKL8566982.1 ShlB/FhaC/HecB family hemolysin secretion/activation protein [Pseudomonas aeruginosa]ELL4313390.1 ShlB/FhaC
MKRSLFNCAHPFRQRWSIGCLAVALSCASLADEAPPAAAGAETQRLVDINEYVVRGNTVLDNRAIEAAVYPFLGPQRSLSDIEGARDALQAAYQEKGYQSVYVELPEQQVSGGVVYLQVTETTVGRVRVVGAKHYSPVELREEVPALEEGKVPDFAQVQRELAQVNRTPGRQVLPMVREGQRPGTMDVDLQVEDKNPWHASIGLNNDYSADTRHLRSVVSLGYDNLWQLGHAISLTYFTAPQDQDNAKVWSGSYTAPLSQRWSVQLSGYQSDSDVATVGSMNVVGQGHSYGVAAIYSLPVTGLWSHSFSFGVDFKDFEEQTRIGGNNDRVPIKYAPLTLGYNGFRYTERSQLALGLSLVAGTGSLLGYGDDDEEFDRKRYRAKSGFGVLKGDLNHTLTFGGDWQVATKAAFQLASGPLISNEQFAAGGATSVRGYLAAENTADDGYLLSQEWRTPSLGRFLGKRAGGYVNDWRFYVFAEGAQLRLQDALPEQDDDFSLASVGIGTRAQLADWLSGSLDWAFPLLEGTNTDKHDSRLHFSVQASF